MSFPLDNLIDYIQDGMVVPIIGRDLLLLELDGENVLLYTYLARRLSRDLEYEPPIEDLNEIAIRLRKGGSRDSVHTRINRILTEEKEKKELPIPEPLRQLAAIEDFPLYVSLTFDTFLQRALDEVRFGGESKTESTAYACRHRHDLPEDYSFTWKTPADPPAVRVYQLLGRHVSTPDGFPVTEENLLEFFHHLQDKKPSRLLGGLRDKHLLILGCNLPDWLTRLLLRLVTPGRLADIRNRYEYLAEEGLRHGQLSKRLVYFLENFSTGTVIYEGNGAREFVAALYRAWCDRKSSRTAADLSTEEAALAETESTNEEPEAIFLSYARENLAAAEEIYRRLSGSILVWFDREKIRIGDRWKSLIKRKIEDCRFFMPVISQQALDKEGPFFKQEWNWAFDRAGRFLPEESFLMPVIIDDVPEEKLPEPLQDAHVVRCAGGELPEEEIRYITDKYRKVQMSRQAQGRWRA